MPKLNVNITQVSKYLIIIILTALISCFITKKTIKPTIVYSTNDTFYIVRDSIIRELDTVFIDKIKIQKIYEQEISRIDTQSVDVDYEYFTKYLSTRFGESISDSIKTSK